jgi:hypothetical protein
MGSAAGADVPEDAFGVDDAQAASAIRSAQSANCRILTIAASLLQMEAN